MTLFFLGLKTKNDFIRKKKKKENLDNFFNRTSHSNSNLILKETFISYSTYFTFLKTFFRVLLLAKIWFKIFLRINIAILKIFPLCKLHSLRKSFLFLFSLPPPPFYWEVLVSTPPSPLFINASKNNQFKTVTILSYLCNLCLWFLHWIYNFA